MKICCEIVWMIHTNVCRSKPRSSMLSIFTENSIPLAARWVVASLKQAFRELIKALNNFSSKHGSPLIAFLF